MLIFVRMLSFTEIRESLSFSARSLLVNRLRTFLSLLGVTIGIFAIIAVFAMVDSMEANILDSFSGMGEDLLMVNKWPMAPEEGETEYPWWKYWQRPEPKLSDVKLLQDRMTMAEGIAFRTGVEKELSVGNSVIDQAFVLMCTQSFEDVYPMDIAEGRFFTRSEEQMSSRVCLIGADVADKLFGAESPLGQEMKIGGKKVEVIGLFEREGESVLGDNIDDIAVIPVSFGRQMADIRETENTILVRAKEGVEVDALKNELTGVLRGLHRLRPTEEKDFAINEMSMITGILDSVFSFFRIIAIVIGSFSILVGGFGIANIMFVSVKERTGIIGIQKALGAKQAFILLQFLIESIFLSVIGGLVALLIIFILTLVATQLMGLDIFLSAKNIGIGLGIAVAIGTIAGFVPAWQASRLSPVDAIRHN